MYLTNPEFKYYRLPEAEKLKLLEKIKKKLETIDHIIFAYIHGSFINRKEFRDLDIAI